LISGDKGVNSEAQNSNEGGYKGVERKMEAKEKKK